jgi:lipopolysaccharide export LptBFGC system permease protein LptF
VGCLHYQERPGLSFSPLVLAFFALSIAAGGSLKRWALGIAACVTFVGYYILLYAGRSLALDGTLPAYVSAWSPNAAVALAAALLTLSKSRTRVGYEPAAP